jgi:hypothetical protein
MGTPNGTALPCPSSSTRRERSRAKQQRAQRVDGLGSGFRSPRASAEVNLPSPAKASAGLGRHQRIEQELLYRRPVTRRTERGSLLPAPGLPLAVGTEIACPGGGHGRKFRLRQLSP